MTELSQIIFTVLFGMLGLYLVIFWVVGLASLGCSYVHDGEKDYSAFYKSKRWGKLGAVGEGEFKLLAGFLLPLLAFAAICIAGIITKEGGGPTLAYISLTIIGVCALLRVARTVVRLSKRLLAHEKDVNAHSDKGDK
jgi:hypothetical protein